MKGIIDFLTGPSLDAQILRDNFVFKVVPMLNPDGVVVGNYRCNLGGLDLNRRWGEPARQDAPTVFALKLVMRQFAQRTVRWRCMWTAMATPARRTYSYMDVIIQKEVLFT